MRQQAKTPSKTKVSSQGSATSGAGGAGTQASLKRTPSGSKGSRARVPAAPARPNGLRGLLVVVGTLALTGFAAMLLLVLSRPSDSQIARNDGSVPSAPVSEVAPARSSTELADLTPAESREREELASKTGEIIGLARADETRRAKALEMLASLARTASPKNRDLIARAEDTVKELLAAPSPAELAAQDATADAAAAADDPVVLDVPAKGGEVPTDTSPGAAPAAPPRESPAPAPAEAAPMTTTTTTSAPAAVPAKPGAKPEGDLRDRARAWFDFRAQLLCCDCKGRGFDVCSTCDGSGKLGIGLTGTHPSVCKTCGGKGRVPCRNKACDHGYSKTEIERGHATFGKLGHALKSSKFGFPNATFDAADPTHATVVWDVEYHHAKKAGEFVVEHSRWQLDPATGTWMCIEVDIPAPPKTAKKK